MSSSQSIGSIAKHLALLFEDLNNDVQNFDSGNYTINTSHLDEKILKLESKFSEIGLLVQCAITNARRRRNALAPIHRLPAELLQGIFQICASTAHESELSPSNIHKDYMMLYPTWGRWRHPNGPNSVYSTMKMVAVCSHWQQLALSTPRLWCYLDSRHSLGLTQVLLERSKFAPLQISCLHGVDPHHEQGFMRLVTPHLDRWISFNSASVNEMLFKNISDYNRSSLLLERFIIHLAERGIVVPSFVLERSPRLRELHIAQTRCPTEIMGLSGLTNLSLNGFIGEKQFQMEQYQTIFSMNPRLETIFLNGPSYSNEDYSPIIINLHKLKTIVLYRVKPGLTAALLLSISPGQGNYPSIQVIGDLNVSPQLSNRTIKGSLKDMLEENMSWLS
ncbi:hypothetical protein FRC02_004390 [Tulasnella sp. 418]|nr:hypothetical protein FRC02_004390 [Tulasnella sp. 418]